MRAALALLALAVLPSAASCTSTPDDLPPCVDPQSQCGPLDAGPDAADAADAATQVDGADD